jgi:hypothetical protein
MKADRTKASTLKNQPPKIPDFRFRQSAFIRGKFLPNRDAILIRQRPKIPAG